MNSAESASLRASLLRLRRRALLVRSSRVFLTTMCLVVPVLILALLAGLGSAALTVALLGIPVAGAAASVIVRPALASVASEVDARLRLHNQLSTALQYAEADDAWSRIVVRNGSAAARAVSPAAAFPFSPPRGFRVLAAVATASLLLLLVDLERTGVARTGVPASVPSVRVPVSSGGGATESSESAAGAPAATSPLIPAAVRARSEGRGSDTARGSAAAAGSAAEDRRGAAGGTSPGDSSTAPGGVSSGALTESAAADSSRGAAPALSHQEAWDGAQSAVSRGRVPARLRAYVRRYLADIREPAP